LPRGRSTPGVTAIRPIATTKSEQIRTDEDRFAHGGSAVTPKRRCGVGVDLLDAAPHGAGLGRASFRHARIRRENQLDPIYATIAFRRENRLRPYLCALCFSLWPRPFINLWTPPT
jgi:hypothetical protein